MMFRSWIDDQDCLIYILDYEPFIPGRLTGLPEHCYPDEGGWGTWEVCDLSGNPDHELANRMTSEDVQRIDQEMFEFMEKKLEEEP